MKASKTIGTTKIIPLTREKVKPLIGNYKKVKPLTIDGDKVKPLTINGKRIKPLTIKTHSDTV